MDNFECSCKGENPNCFKCGGTGLVESERGQVGRPAIPLGKDFLSEPPKSTATSEREKIKVKSSFLSDSEIEGLAQEAYKRAKERIVKYKQRLDAKKSQIINAPIWVQCPLCEVKVKRLEKHFMKHHTPEGRELKEKQKEEKKKKKVAKSREVKTGVSQLTDKAFSEYRRLHPHAKMCGFCKDFFENPNSLRGHLRLIHPESGDATASGSPSQKRTHIVSSTGKHGPTGTKSVDSHKGQITEDSKVERQMDATYGLGGFARDGGRFGSPSTYDSMDDESFS